MNDSSTKSAIYLVDPTPGPIPSIASRYSYNNGKGDSYQGYFYAPTGYNGYKIGYTKTVTDENKQTGTYKITAAQDIGQDSSKYGQVFVTKYYRRRPDQKDLYPLAIHTASGQQFPGQ